jgi:glutathione S-transferase
MQTPPTLFGLRRSVYTRIAALALKEKGVTFDLDEVEIFGLAGVPADHLQRHPFGKIPVLVHDDFLLYETQAICRYIDEAFDGPSLQPNSPRARARVAQVIGVLDSYAYQPMVWGVFVQRVLIPLRGGVADEAVIDDALPRVEKTLDVLDSFIGTAQFLSGESPTLADLHAYPMLAYLRLAPEGRSAMSRRPAIERWLRRMTTRPAVSETRTEYE